MVIMGVIKPLEEPQELAGERDNTGPATCLCDVGGGVEWGKPSGSEARDEGAACACWRAWDDCTDIGAEVNRVILGKLEGGRPRMGT